MKNSRISLLCGFISLLHTPFGFSQSNGINYSFAQPAVAMTFNNSTAGSVSLIAGGTDDSLVSFAAPLTWAGFYYGGVWFPEGSTLYVSSNGWLSLSSQPGSLPDNSLAQNTLLIAPLWDDLKVHADGEVTYKITGGSSSRAIVVEWRGMLWDHNAADSAISFQAILYDKNQAVAANRNAIEFRYRRNGNGSMFVNNQSGGASIGLSGFCNGDVFAFTSAAGSPSKTAPEISNISIKPVGFIGNRFYPANHPNDECFTAEPINFDPALAVSSTSGTTLHSGPSPDSLPTCGSPATISDVWFTFTKPSGITNFEIFTDSLDCRGTNFLTGLEVYDACGSPSVNCDFGSSGPPGTNASSYLYLVNQPCTAQQYWVRVYSVDTTYRGYFRFNVRPPGRNCSFANDLTGCGLPYAAPSGLSTCGFGFDYDSVNAEPHTANMSGEDYVFTYTPSSTVCVDFTLNNTPANSNPGLFIYQGCPGTGTCIFSVTGPGGSALNFQNVSLAAGLTYYFVVDNDSSGGGCLPGFDFEVTLSSGSAAAYDDCTASQNIPVLTAASCNGTFDYTTSCASPTVAGLFTVPGCGNFTDGITPDVWFTFTSVGTSVHRLVLDPGTAPAAQDLAVAVYTGSCGGMVLVNCDDNSNIMMPSLPIVPPVAGTLYYIRVWSNNGTQPGNFRICVVNGCTATNDTCAGAIPLIVGQYARGENSCASGINEPFAGTGAACWVNAGPEQLNTVWYSFVATDDTMRIRTNLLSLFDSQLALYSSTGGCGGTFTELFCNNNTLTTCGQGPGRNSDITATGLTQGSTYYIRVDGVNSSTGTFDIIVMAGADPFPPQFAQDCPLAISLCNNNILTVSNPGYQGSGNICDVQPGSTCLANGENHSVFYTFNVMGSGAGTPVEFTITPSGAGNYDFMLWCIDTVYNSGDQLPAVPGYCSQLGNENMFPAAACNFSSQGITGCSASEGLCQMICYQNYGFNDPGMMPAVVVPNGMTATFLLMVNSDFNLNGFTLDWMGTPISGTAPWLIWQGRAGANWADSSNWNSGNCGTVPDCAGGIEVIIPNSAVMPVISSNASVSGLTINTGATLSIDPGITLEVCGNFTNNGTLNCGTGSIVRFTGSRNTVISGTFNPDFNNFHHMEVSKDSGSSVTLNTDLFITGNDSIYGGLFNGSNHNVEVGGNFYNVDGNASYNHFIPGTLSFTGRSGLPQSFRNDGSVLTLANITMNQIIPDALTLDSNSTSDLIIGSTGSLTLTSGKIKTGILREVNISNPLASSCSAGNDSAYIEGNLRRAIGTFISTYDFPVGDSAKGYQHFAIEYTSPPAAAYHVRSSFRQWTTLPPSGPALAECTNSGWDILPPFDNGYWTLDADTSSGNGTFRAHAYPSGVANSSGTTFSIMKSASNNGQGPWQMEGSPYCASTAAHVEREGLSSFSDFAVVQSDIGSFDLNPVTNKSGFSISPNPASEKITLTFYTTEEGESRLQLCDLTGRIVTQAGNISKKGLNVLELSLENVSKGMYLLVLESNSLKSAEKLIVR